MRMDDGRTRWSVSLGVGRDSSPAVQKLLLSDDPSPENVSSILLLASLGYVSIFNFFVKLSAPST